MSLYSAMFTGVSGLQSQSKSLANISENIANVNTIGYKAVRTDFHSLAVGQAAVENSTTSGVRSSSRQLIDVQGLLQTTDRSTDIGITGGGFMPVTTSVSGGTGELLFTRAGAFDTDANQNLVNSSGHFLMGWPLDGDGQIVNGANQPITPDPTSDNNLEVVNLSGLTGSARGTNAISLEANLPADATPGEELQTSVQVFDGLGISHQMVLDWKRMEEISVGGTLDPAAQPIIATESVVAPDGSNRDLTLTYTPLDATRWQAVPSAVDGTVTGGPIELSFEIDGSLASPPAGNISILWSDGSGDSVLGLDHSAITQVASGLGAAVSTQRNANGAAWQLNVSTNDSGDVLTGQESSIVRFHSGGSRDGLLASPSDVDVTVNWNDADSFAGDSALTIDLGTPGRADGLSSFGDDYAVRSIQQNGLASGAFTNVEIGEDGTVTANFDNGASRAVYRVPLATFNNPNGLTARDGNAFARSADSGSFLLNIPGHGGAGTLSSRTLEASTVDIAEQFSNMIITQRSYSANATLITTADEMLEELGRLK